MNIDIIAPEDFSHYVIAKKKKMLCYCIHVMTDMIATTGKKCTQYNT